VRVEFKLNEPPPQPPPTIEGATITFTLRELELLVLVMGRTNPTKLAAVFEGDTKRISYPKIKFLPTVREATDFIYGLFDALEKVRK